MQKELDRLFDAFMQPSQSLTTETTFWRPPMDIYETIDSFVIKMEVAGIKPDEDVQIQLNQNILTIKGYRQDRTALKKEHYHQAELHYGPFERSIVLPNILAEDIEPKASYESGFLEIHLPKAKNNRPKEITVQVKGESETTHPVLKELDDADPS